MTAGDLVTSLVDQVGLGGDSNSYTLTSFSSEGQYSVCLMYLLANVISAAVK